MQIGAFQAKFHEFGSRGIWDTVYPIYVVKSLILWQNLSFYYINSVYPWKQIHEIWLEVIQFAF